MDYAKLFLERVQTRANIGSIENDSLIIKEIGLILTVNSIDIEENACLVNYQMTYPAFNEILCDVIPVLGDTEQELIDMAAFQFLALCLLPIFKGLSREDKSIITQELFGQKAEFIECSSELLQMGSDAVNPASHDLYDLIKDDLLQYIGFKQIYFIRIYAAKNNTKPIYEVRIDDEIIPELSLKIKDYAHALQNTEAHISRIQTVTLWGKNGIKAPFNFPFIRNLCHEHILGEYLKLGANSQEQYEAIYETILKHVEDAHLAQDIYALIPEIACEVFFEGKFWFNQTIALVNGKNNINIYSSQLSLYRYLKIAISQYIDEHNINEQDALNLFGRSSRWSALTQELERDENIVEIKSSMLALIVDEDYILY